MNDTNPDPETPDSTETTAIEASDLELAEISGVTWTEDDGTTYRRVMNDGDIKDIPVGHE